MHSKNTKILSVQKLKNKKRKLSNFLLICRALEISVTVPTTKKWLRKIAWSKAQFLLFFSFFLFVLLTFETNKKHNNAEFQRKIKGKIVTLFYNFLVTKEIGHIFFTHICFCFKKTAKKRKRDKLLPCQARSKRSSHNITLKFPPSNSISLCSLLQIKKTI